MLMLDPIGLLGGVSEHVLAGLAHRKIDAGRDLRARRSQCIHLLANRFARSSGQTVLNKLLVLAQDAQQKMLGFYMRRSVLAGLVASEEDYAAGFFCVALEHRELQIFLSGGLGGALPIDVPRHTPYHNQGASQRLLVAVY